MCRGRENSGLGLGGLAVSVSSFWGGHLTVLHVQESLHCAFKVGELPWQGSSSSSPLEMIWECLGSC